MLVATLLSGLLALSGHDLDSPKPPRPASDQHVQVHVDASRTNARGLQLVTVRLKIDPGWQIYGYAGDEDRTTLGLRLAAKTRNPRTRVDILYPQDKSGSFSHRVLEGEVAIQVIVQRAPGDTSPIEGRVDFCVDGMVL